MIDSYLRARVQRSLIEPIASALVRTEVNHHVVTAGALLIGVIASVLIALAAPWSAVLLLTVSGYLDTIDGSMARIKGSDSPVGAVFDICADRAVEFSVILGLFLYAPESRGLLCLCMLGSVLLCITSFLVVGIFSQGDGEKSFHYSPGIMERSEAFLFFGVMVLLPSAFTLLAVTFTALVTMTALWRVAEFSRKEGVRFS